MLGKCFSLITISSFIYAAATGRLGLLSGAILDGAGRAVTLSYSLLGVMCLWGGIMALLNAVGMIKHLSRLLRPILKFAFPYAFRTKTAEDEIVACVSANLLGIGNAATPLAISAMKKMREDSGSDEATDDMITLAVLGTAPPNLFPSTLVALRSAAGCSDPYSVIVPIWIVSTLTSLFGVVLCRAFASSRRRA